MTWENLRENWQRNAAATMPTPRVEDTLRRAKRRRIRILWRDGIESVLALLLLPFVLAWFLQVVRTHAVLPTLSVALVLLWLFYVPWRLWRTRRLMPRRDSSLPMQRYLELEREAMLAQARMLRNVIWWYLMPPFAAMIGLLFASGWPTQRALVGAAEVFMLYVFIEHANRRAARKIVRDLLPDIDARIRELEAMEASPSATPIDDTAPGSLP